MRVVRGTDSELSYDFVSTFVSLRGSLQVGGGCKWDKYLHEDVEGLKNIEGHGGDFSMSKSELPSFGRSLDLL